MTTSPVRHRRSGASAAALLLFAAAVAAAALVGGLAAATSAQEYAGLIRPSWAPPAGVFGPVWTVLYILIAVSAWLVWRRAGWTTPAHPVWCAQLVLNAGWTPLFFAAGLIGVAFAEIVVLWVAVLATIVLFARTDRLAAGLLLPYLAWVSFAGALNLAIWQLN
jgi:tryptophan-rich sensory protein